MSNITTKENIPDLRPEERALLLNDLSKLDGNQRSDLYAKVCSSIGINPLTQPFQYLQLSGKLVFYATRNCTDQLRSLHVVSVTIQSREKIDDLYVVTARATLPGGRTDESIAAVTLNGLRGDALANAIMKCETKAKRRVTLSICGLSFMDESEVETVRDAKVVDVNQAHQSSQPQIQAPAPAPNATSETIDHELANAPEDELDQALNKHPEGSAERAAQYKIPFGQFSGKRICEVAEAPMRAYLNWLAQNRMNQPGVKELLQQADAYFGVN